MNFATNSTHPLETPEILAIISSHLTSSNDLANASRVNKTWLGPFTSKLYRVVKRHFLNDNKNATESAKSKKIALLKALERRSVHVREFYCPWNMDMEQLNPFPDLAFLTNYAGPDVSPNNIDLQVSILEKNSATLQSVRIEWHYCSLSNDLIKVLASLKHLRSMNLTSVLIPENAVRHLLESLPNLYHLGINDLELSESQISEVPLSEIDVLARQSFVAPCFFSSSPPINSPLSSTNSTKIFSYRLKSLSFEVYELTVFSLELLLGIMSASPDLVRLEYTTRYDNDGDELSRDRRGFYSISKALHDRTEYPAVKDLIVNSEEVNLGYLLCQQDPVWPSSSMFPPEYDPRPNLGQFLTLRTLHLTTERGVSSEVAILAIWAGSSALGDTLEDLMIMDNNDMEDISCRVSGEIVNILCRFSCLRSVVLNKVMIEATDLFEYNHRPSDKYFRSNCETESESEFESESETSDDVVDDEYSDDEDQKRIQREQDHERDNKKNGSVKEMKVLTALEKRDKKMLERMRSWLCRNCLETLEISISKESGVHRYNSSLEAYISDHIEVFFGRMPKLNQNGIDYISY
ncbi:hypothetical protein BGZ83_010185 [Gryganskiella cystojenkinii]|nr:hypothetical protein BGZ83_010185 [Gryganskiella cystojenkinii]